MNLQLNALHLDEDVNLFLQYCSCLPFSYPAFEPSLRQAAGRVHRKDKKIDFQFAR
jgi:hypothetical protein